MNLEVFKDFSPLAIDAVVLAESEAHWRQRKHIHVAHLLLGIIGVEPELDSLFKMNWSVASEDTEMLVRQTINVTKDNQWSPSPTVELENALATASTLSNMQGRVKTQHLLMSVMDDAELRSLYEGRWGISHSELKEHLMDSLANRVTNNRRTRERQISVAKKHIEICNYRELNSKTLGQKSQIRDIRKGRRQWEELLSTLLADGTNDA